MMHGQSSEAIDFRAASELFSSREKTLSSSSFATQGLTVNAGRQIVASTGGMLIFGRDRERWFPDAYLKAGLFAGSERSQIVDNKEFKSHLLRQLREAKARLHYHGDFDPPGLQIAPASKPPAMALN